MIVGSDIRLGFLRFSKVRRMHDLFPKRKRKENQSKTQQERKWIIQFKVKYSIIKELKES